MSEQLALAIDTPQLVWKPPAGRHACGRDPAAGSGSCYHWWDGCSKAEKRGCFSLWAKSEAVLTHWAEQAPAEWTPAPIDLHPVTAGKLRDQRVIELRVPEGERWQWRRRVEAAS